MGGIPLMTWISGGLGLALILAIMAGVVMHQNNVIKDRDLKAAKIETAQLTAINQQNLKTITDQKIEAAYNDGLIAGTAKKQEAVRIEYRDRATKVDKEAGAPASPDLICAITGVCPHSAADASTAGKSVPAK